MRGLGLLVIGLAAMTWEAAVAQTLPVIVQDGHAVSSPAPAAIADQVAEATCDDAPVTPVHAEAMAATAFSAAPEGANRNEWARDLHLTFTIDSAGHPRDIRGSGAWRGSTSGIGYADDEAKAALAVWRFQPEARSDCQLTVRRSLTPLDQADIGLLAKGYGTSPVGGTGREAVRARLSPDCLSYPPLRIAAFPDLRLGTVRAGGRAWTVAHFDIADDGVVMGVTTLGSSGDAALDAEGRRAAAATVFQAGQVRRGCIVSFGRGGANLPNAPEPEPTGDELQSCPAEVRARYRTGRPIYPAAFRRRGVEGWAIIRYDIASWGEVGNVEVVQAQPADTFGEEARRIVRQGRAAPGFAAGIRCIDRVIFRMSDQEAPTSTDAVAGPSG